MPTTAEKRAAFRRLHESGCFVIPNPWDIGTTRYLQRLGFKALATTSAGFAWSRGPRRRRRHARAMLAHIAELSAAADVPMNADFEGGYADEPQGVADSVRLCVATGVAGLSIEDSTGDPAKPLYDFDMAVARMRAARAAIDKAGGDVLLTGRSECFIRGRPDLAETIRRLQAYAAAGADACTRRASRRASRSPPWWAVAPKPVNLLMGGARVSRWPTSPRSACAASASAARWRAPPGGASSAWPGRSPTGQLQGLRRAAPGADIVKGLRG